MPQDQLVPTGAFHVECVRERLSRARMPDAPGSARRRRTVQRLEVRSASRYHAAVFRHLRRGASRALDRTCEGYSLPPAAISELRLLSP